MVEVVFGVPSHASCHDRPPGYMGSPLAPGWPRSGPDHRGFPAANWHLHPDGRPTRGYHSAHQTSEWREGGYVLLVCCLDVLFSCWGKSTDYIPQSRSLSDII